MVQQLRATLAWKSWRREPWKGRCGIRNWWKSRWDIIEGRSIIKDIDGWWLIISNMIIKINESLL